MPSNRSRVLAAAILVPAALAAWPGRAQEVTSLVTVDGRCTRMVMPGDDVTAVCDGKLINGSRDDGRTNFSWAAKRQGAKPVTISFVGPGANQVKAADGTVTQPVDGVIVNRGEGPEPVKATGTCRFADPRRRGAVIACVATTERGKFDAAFTASGKPPVVVDPRRT